MYNNSCNSFCSLYYLSKKKLFANINKKYDIVVGIPYSPFQISGRISIRNTFGKIKHIKNYSTKCIFVTGLPKSSSYRIEYLKYENSLFDDTIVLNIINSYENLTLTMFSFYKWVINNYKSLKYFIRCNLDTLFIPKNIITILNTKFDVVGEFFYNQKENITYPQGSFYIFSLKALKTVYYNRETVKLNRFDDVIYGKIFALVNNLSIVDINNSGLMISHKQCKFNINNLKNTFVIHPVNPQVLYILYKLL